MKEVIISQLKESSRIKLEVAKKLHKPILQSAKEIIKAYKKNKKVVLFGNGGSAADAQHIAGEFVGRFLKERRPLSAISFSTDTSIMTAVANDYGVEHMFSRQVRAIVEKGDVVIAISTSGNSLNVLKGAKEAKKKGAKVLGFTGRKGGKLKNISDICINVPSDLTPRIQEAHITIAHIICGLVEKELFPG